LAGLSAAAHLRMAGVDDVLVVEAQGGPGGWVRTDWDGDYGADRAIHVLYFRDESMRAWVEELLGGDWFFHVKNCLIDSGGVRTPFPYHANLYRRPESIVNECLEGMAAAMRAHTDDAPPPVTFAEWIDRAQGPGVARHFMTPYNTKLWTVPPSQMGCDWMGSYIPKLDYERVVRGAREPATSEVGLNAHFYYARRGGSQLSEALAARAGRVRYGTRLVALDARARRATFDDGSNVNYDALVSTIPLPRLGQLLTDLPPELRASLDRLESTDLVLADVGFADPDVRDVHWVYFPDPDVLPYRLHAVHALTPDMMPPDHGLYCLEISHSKHRPLPPGSIRERVIDDLVRTRWLRSPSQVTFYRERRFSCSYVIPRVGFRADADAVRDHARALGIHSIGRFGEWKYCNQEDALIDGRAVARLLAGASHAAATRAQGGDGERRS
jgi:protoporphyrinogen oxidase